MGWNRQQILHSMRWNLTMLYIYLVCNFNTDVEIFFVCWKEPQKARAASDSLNKGKHVDLRFSETCWFFSFFWNKKLVKNLQVVCRPKSYWILFKYRNKEERNQCTMHTEQLYVNIKIVRCGLSLLSACIYLRLFTCSTLKLN